jgi:hypothetical protein
MVLVFVLNRNLPAENALKLTKIGESRYWIVKDGYINGKSDNRIEFLGNWVEFIERLFVFFAAKHIVE